MDAIYHNEYKNNILDREYYDELSNKTWFVKKELRVEHIENGVILPFVPNENRIVSWGKGGVLDSEKNYVELSSSTNYGRCEEDRMKGSYAYDESLCKTIDEEVVYIGFIINHYGHLLVDCVNRLWYIIKYHPQCRIAYLPETGTKMGGAFEEIMNIMGIDSERLLPIIEPTKFKNVIIPERSEYPGKYWTKEFKDTFDYIRDQVPTDTRYEKIYFTRRNLMISFVKERGEQELIPLLKKAGFAVLSPEKYSIKQKIAMMKGCKEMATICGTTPFQYLFGNDNSKLIVFNKTYESNIFEFMINSIRHLDVTYVDAYYSLFPTNIGHGPFIILKNDNVVNFFKDRYNIITSKSKYIHSYIRWYLSRYFDFNPELRNNVDSKLLYDYFRKPLGKYKFDVKNILLDLEYNLVSVPYFVKMKSIWLYNRILSKFRK